MARRKWNYNTIQQVLDGEQPFIQFGYEPDVSRRKEGEIWKDSRGRKWQKKNGYKVQISSADTPILDKINELSRCSVCGTNVRAYGNKLDQKVFPKTGKCYDCLEAEEMKYRVNGQWDNYEKMKVLKNKLGALKEFKEKVIDSINYLKNDSGKVGEVMSNGEVITWTGKCNPQWLIDAERDLIKVNQELEKMNKEITTLESELKK
jgi:hypothetical protein